MGERRTKDALFDGFAQIGKALGSGRRAELLDVLAQGERHVDALADEIGQTVANTSFHLQTLAAAGLVMSRRDGNRIVYRLASDRVLAMWAAMRDVATAHLRELEPLAAAYRGVLDDVEVVSRDELSRRLGDGDVIVLDVRPPAEFAAGHIPGARSIPIAELSERLATLPAAGEIVAYCRGPFCVFADDAVRLARDNGRRASRLEDGFPEWRVAGFPIETSG